MLLYEKLGYKIFSEKKIDDELKFIYFEKTEENGKKDIRDGIYGTG